VVGVPDPRLAVLAEIVKPERVLPAAVEFVDIAGLVAGASKGEGLGNQFLANIRETHAIANVVRCFEDGNVIHVNNKVDPISDIEVIHTELALADMQSIEKAKHRFGKTLRSGDKEAMKMVPLLERVEKALDGFHPVRAMGLTKDEMAMLQPLQLLTAKPALYIANVGEHGFKDNPLLERVKEYAKKEGAPVVAVSAKMEADIADLSDEDKEMFLQEMGMTEPGLDRVIHATYDLLGLETYFTAGEKEVRAWTIHAGDTAPKAAGVIHSDFERGFIKAETVAYDDLVACGSTAAAREKGLYRMEGKEYVVADGDVLLFKFNV